MGRSIVGDPKSEDTVYEKESALLLGLIKSDVGEIVEKDSFELDIVGAKGSSNKGTQVETPPINFKRYARLLEVNTRLHRCIHTYARNTVGMGWEIKFKDSTITEDSPEFGSAQEQITRLEKFFNSVGASTLTPFTTMMYLLKVDEETMGNAALEVIRNQKGEVVDLAHIPMVNMKILKDGKGWIQTKGKGKQIKQSFFKNFGNKSPMNSRTGKGGGGKGIRLGSRATELLHFKKYSPVQDFYGLPRFVAAVPAISGNRLSAERNVAFFDNDTVPRMLMTVTGGSLGEGSIRRLDEFMSQRLGGPANAHRCLVLNVRANSSGFNSLLGGSPPAPNLDITPLTVGTIEDSSFQTYRVQNDEEIRESFGLAEVFFIQSSANRESAGVGRKITNEQEFDPDRMEKEYIINHTIVKEILGVEEPLVKFVFKGIQTDDDVVKANIISQLSATAALTINDIRKMLDLKEFPKDTHLFGEKPFAISLAEFEAGVSPFIIPEQNEIGRNSGLPPTLEEATELKIRENVESQGISVPIEDLE